MAREITSAVLTLIEEGVLDRDSVILACLNYMSEDEVCDMAHINGFLDDEEDEADE